ncbi:hypothetical protein Tco_0226429 [Tanacetum coccineum]
MWVDCGAAAAVAAGGILVTAPEVMERRRWCARKSIDSESIKGESVDAWWRLSRDGCGDNGLGGGGRCGGSGVAVEMVTGWWCGDSGGRGDDVASAVVAPRWVACGATAAVAAEGINKWYQTKMSENETSISKTSKDIVEKPKNVRPSAPIIEDWDTDSDNDNVFRPKTNQTKQKFTKINFVKSDENVKSVINKGKQHKQSRVILGCQCPGVNRELEWNDDTK